ncbi:CBS domain-containing protein [Arhodomonas sp. SL1]|uniref:CBS domain-containing protein n=1 Tax=Arhodomonas sp. SL1 TaxID=3425691 RepID=UPI003F885805
MYPFLAYKVHHVMVRDVVTITPDRPLSALDALFAEYDFNSVPVVEEGTTTLRGVITKLDLLAAFQLDPTHIVPPYEEIMTRTVGEYMSADPLWVPPELPLSRALQRMVEMRNKAFPVLADGRLTGIVAREDLLAALHRAARGEGPPES